MRSRTELARYVNLALGLILAVLAVASLVELIATAQRAGRDPGYQPPTDSWILLALGVASIIYGLARMYFRHELAEAARRRLESGKRPRWSLISTGFSPEQIFRSGVISVALGVFVVWNNWP